LFLKVKYGNPAQHSLPMGTVEPLMTEFDSTNILCAKQKQTSEFH